jgi:hypothetical protein
VDTSTTRSDQDQRGRGCQQEHRKGSAVAVARDDTDKFMGATALVYPGKTEDETLEALACREHVGLAKDIYARRVRLASDCQNVIRNLQQGTRGVCAHIV